MPPFAGIITKICRVYTVKDSKIEQRLVQIGHRNDLVVEILPGLNKGDSDAIHSTVQI
jgi:glycerol-3-phosphate responsive antiterminator